MTTRRSPHAIERHAIESTSRFPSVKDRTERINRSVKFEGCCSMRRGRQPARDDQGGAPTRISKKCRTVLTIRPMAFL